jgi:hypothetical protein
VSEPLLEAGETPAVPAQSQHRRADRLQSDSSGSLPFSSLQGFPYPVVIKLCQSRIARSLC